MDFDARLRAVRIWLLAVAALVFAAAAVGGATRVTGSGLSIVEWRPVTGVVPPLSDAAWRTEFEKYKIIPQYRELNRGMSLREFKTIYWWEWTHRLLGRLIGAVFLVPFLFFLWRGFIGPGLRLRLWIIFGLGAVQGGVGWWMVSSGLADRVSVAHTRLAFHLTLACAIFALVLWTAQCLKPRPPLDVPGRLRAGAVMLVIVALVQIYLGALVAGLRAGLVYNTWPGIDGALVPDAARLLSGQPWWRSFFDNPLLVQFDHRMVAYLLFALAVLHAADAARARAGVALNGALVVVATVAFQAALGIVTLVHVTPVPLALAHQAMTVVVLAAVVIHVERLSARSEPAAANPPFPVADRR